LRIEVRRRVRFEEEVVIEGILHPSEAARLNYEFTLRNGRGEVATTGFTVHLMLDREERVLLVPPAFFLEFQARWRRGELP
jgi:acyl-CoA thioester hydrolase